MLFCYNIALGELKFYFQEQKKKTLRFWQVNFKTGGWLIENDFIFDKKLWNSMF